MMCLPWVAFVMLLESDDGYIIISSAFYSTILIKYLEHGSRAMICLTSYAK